MRPLVARISAGALRHNLAVARAAAGRARLWAVVKANAYGHGLLETADALRAADGFAVLCLDEAMHLRAAGFPHPILLLEGVFAPGEWPEAARLGLYCVIHHADQLASLAAARLPAPVAVYLKVNTGMNRLGLRPAECAPALERLRGCANAGPVTLMTHFASADEDAGVSEQFDGLRALAAGRGLPCSAANSAALLRHPETLGDWARPGLMLFGASPLAGATAADLGLRPAMTLATELISVYEVAAGERIGYGGTFTAPSRMRIGVAACGYADGYPRHAPSGTPALVDGRQASLVGRVSMDMLALDVSGVPGARRGSPVVLWGAGLPVEEVASHAGTIAYELLCARAGRVPLRWQE